LTIHFLVANFFISRAASSAIALKKPRQAAGFDHLPRLLAGNTKSALRLNFR
jgi:hypothetical protein